MLSAMFDVDSTHRPAPPTRPLSAPERARERAAASAESAGNLGEIGVFPGWARLSDAHADGADAAFHAGAGLALFDQLLRSGEDGAEPVFAGALRSRLALKAAATCARLARLREEEGALRDAEHLAPIDAPPSPAGRLHRLFRLFGGRPLRLDGATLGAAAEILALPIDGAALADLVAAVQERASQTVSPLAVAIGASHAARAVLNDAAPVDGEILALWLADLALAQKLGWAAPVPLIAAAIQHPALRIGPNGRRPRPGDPPWPETVARAYARACQNATALGADLSRRAEKLLQVAPRLRARGAARVVDMLLNDDCVTPARAAKASGLSDRAARRLCDRLIELRAVRELSGRSNFRLYGL
jgi:hypothetical protein